MLFYLTFETYKNRAFGFSETGSTELNHNSLTHILDANLSQEDTGVKGNQGLQWFAVSTAVYIHVTVM